jgi:iron only hydrogenase large subunit-like protein
MIKDQRIDFPKLKGSKFDQLFGNYSDLAPLFGTSGGVMVCAIKFLAKLLENKDLTINFTSLLGFKEIKVANVKLLGKQLKIAIINGAKNVKQFQESYDFSSFHFIEVMTCVNGCINGGGQPIILDKSDQEFNKIILARSKGLRNQKINLSTSLDNLQCRKIYQLLKMVPNDELAIKLFHNSTNKQ